MATERKQKPKSQAITISLSDENIKELDEVKSILKKTSGSSGNRSRSARILISLGAKVVEINRLQSVLQSGTDISRILKELTCDP